MLIRLFFVFIFRIHRWCFKNKSTTWYFTAAGFIGMTYHFDVCKPKRCSNCARKKFEEQVVDTIAGHACEIDIICSHCGEHVGYWAHGNYVPF